ncbi:LTA synthase family protein [Fictibacillus iocasae]|uniref:LTA synthase family protein n=1 Tax=Fictibacillus iocasae TaxID=2715437 RepID=A0ABW2NSR5_9BACL
MLLIVKKHPALLLAISFLWLKTYIVYQLSFNLSGSHLVQQLLLFINPLSFLVFYIGLAYFVSVNRRNRIIFILSLVYSIILYVNAVYYRFFTDFITVPVLFQTKNAGDIGNSLYELVYAADVLFFADTVLLYMLLKKPFFQAAIVTTKTRRMVMMTGAVLLALQLSLAETQRPQLLTRTFDRHLLVKNLGTFNYHLYDILLYSKSSMKSAFASNVDADEMKKQAKDDPVNNPKLFGAAKGKNLIVVSLESTQSFVIDYKVNGQEVTPFLNKLARSSYYFPNFYHQTGQGKTSDAEFITDNSLYPLPRGAVFQTHALNEYKATPEILKEKGYYSAVFHGNDKSFWNRDIMYQTLGYDHYFSEEYYDRSEEDSVNYGLKDIPFVEQTVPYLKKLPKPFYAKVITLTNHHPYLLNEEDQMIDTFPSSDPIVSRYFTTVRYADEAIKVLFSKLKKARLYKNSVIVIYGDHYGISERHEEGLAQILKREDGVLTPFDHVQLQRVPLFIHVPGKKGKQIKTIGGQIDLKPTLLHLLGINLKGDYHFGTDLFSKKREELAVFRDGTVISKDLVYTDESCFTQPSGTETDPALCEPLAAKAQEELDRSDDIIYGDLLRFLVK